jgi:hypothetical protein
VNPVSCDLLASSPKRLGITFLSCTTCICQESSGSHRSSGKARGDCSYSSFGRPMSKSSDHHKPTSGTSNKRRVYKSDQDKINQNLFWVHHRHELATEGRLQLLLCEIFISTWTFMVHWYRFETVK